MALVTPPDSVEVGEKSVRPLAYSRHRVSLRGVVTDAVTGEPVPGAVVAIAEAPTAGQPPQAFMERLDGQRRSLGAAWEGSASRLDRAVSGPGGVYAFRDLPDGPYRVEAWLPRGGTRYDGFARGVVVDAAGAGIPKIDIRLQPTVIKGTVTRRGDSPGKNQPLPMVQVRLNGSGERTFTDDQGRFSLVGVETGQAVDAAPTSRGSRTLILDPSPRFRSGRNGSTRWAGVIEIDVADIGRGKTSVVDVALEWKDNIFGITASVAAAPAAIPLVTRKIPAPLGGGGGA